VIDHRAGAVRGPDGDGQVLGCSGRHGGAPAMDEAIRRFVEATCGADDTFGRMMDGLGTPGEGTDPQGRHTVAEPWSCACWKPGVRSVAGADLLPLHDKPVGRASGWSDPSSREGASGQG
jgi:hypothetical protein